jgi:hypothetical protein
VKSLGWLLLVVGVECAGIVACSKIPGFSSPPPAPVFNSFEVGGWHVYELRLKDGTHCAVYAATSISCDWSNK